MTYRAEACVCPAGKDHSQPSEQLEHKPEVKQRSSTPLSFDSLATSEPGAGSDGFSPVTQPNARPIKRSESDMHKLQEPVWSPQLSLDKLAERFDTMSEASQLHSSSYAPQMAPGHGQYDPAQLLQQPAGQMSYGEVPVNSMNTGRHPGQHDHGELYTPAPLSQVQQEAKWQHASLPSQSMPLYAATCAAQGKQSPEPSHQQSGADGYFQMPQHSSSQLAAPHTQPHQYEQASHVPLAGATSATLPGMQQSAMHQLHPGQLYEPTSEPAGQPPLPPEPGTQPAGATHAGIAHQQEAYQAAYTPMPVSQHAATPGGAANHTAGHPHMLSQLTGNAEPFGQAGQTAPAAATAAVAAHGNQQLPGFLGPQGQVNTPTEQHGMQSMLAQAQAASSLPSQQDPYSNQGVTPASIAAALALLQANPQLVLPSTVLSPELAAALASGGLGQSLDAKPAAHPTAQGYGNQQHQAAQQGYAGPEYSNPGSGTGVHSQAMVPNRSAPPLPPELSAALAFGQLPVPLQPSASVQGSQAPADMQLSSQAHDANPHQYAPVPSASGVPSAEYAAAQYQPQGRYQPGGEVLNFPQQAGLHPQHAVPSVQAGQHREQHQQPGLPVSQHAQNPSQQHHMVQQPTQRADYLPDLYVRAPTRDQPQHSRPSQHQLHQGQPLQLHPHQQPPTTLSRHAVEPSVARHVLHHPQPALHQGTDNGMHPTAISTHRHPPGQHPEQHPHSMPTPHGSRPPLQYDEVEHAPQLPGPPQQSHLPHVRPGPEPLQHQSRPLPTPPTLPQPHPIHPRQQQPQSQALHYQSQQPDHAAYQASPQPHHDRAQASSGRAYAHAHANRQHQHVDRQQQQPDRPHMHPDRQHQQLDGQHQHPDRQHMHPDRPHQQLDGQHQYPDRQQQQPDRQHQHPDRQHPHPDRQHQHPDRQYQHPDRQQQHDDHHHQQLDRQHDVGGHHRFAEAVPRPDDGAYEVEPASRPLYRQPVPRPHDADMHPGPQPVRHPDEDHYVHRPVHADWVAQG